MDPLSWFLLVWIAVSAVIFFIVQTILPIFIPPPERPAEQKTGQKSTPKSESGYAESAELQPLSNDQNHKEQPFAAFSSWAASTFGVGHPGQVMGESCDWVNDLLTWIYRHAHHSPDLANAWLRAMNDASSKVAPALGCDVYFEEVIATSEDPKSGPRLSAIRSEFGPREHLTMRANVTYPKLVIRVVASQKLPDRLLVSNYLTTLRNLSGQAHVRMACIGDDLFFMVCFEGKPDVAITFENGDQIAAGCVDQTLVDEIVKRCLASAVTNVSLAKLQEQPLANKAVMNGNDAIVVSAADIKQCQAVTMQDRQRSNRLLLKVERAERLGGGKPPAQPYVVVELDEPAQKHTTTLGFKGNPVWEEQFLFELNDKSEEILFEVYDRPAHALGAAPIAGEDEPKFLGLAIVGVEELRQSVNLTHTLSLQARPYKDDIVSGTLTVEFIFLREQFAETRSGRRASRREPGETQQIRPLLIVTDLGPAPGGLKTSQYIDGAPEEEPLLERRLPPKVRGTSSYGSTVTGASSSKTPPSPAAVSEDRGRKREPSFFDDLKLRLSFRKSRGGRGAKRAHSLESDIDGPRDSQEQLRLGPGGGSGVQQGRSVSTPASRDPSQSRKRADHTPLTSDSELSVTSTDSVFPQSHLVVEAVEDGAKKYYLLPLPVQRHTLGKRLMKAGKKLHIHNEHTFTAVKTRAGSTCGVCNALIATAFRRKGYQCRDCGFICHKRCHFKTETRCPFSKVSTLPIEVVKIS